MTVADAQQAFQQALHHDDDAVLLISFLRLIIAVEQVIHSQIQELLSLESADNPELYRETLQLLMTRDMLAYVSATSAAEAVQLRDLVAVAAPDRIIGWYDRQWSEHAMRAADIIASIASALRTALTVIYGNLSLLRDHTSPNTAQETAFQYIIEAVDKLRACQSHIRNHLAAEGILIQPF